PGEPISAPRMYERLGQGREDDLFASIVFTDHLTDGVGQLVALDGHRTERRSLHRDSPGRRGEEPGHGPVTGGVLEVKDGPGLRGQLRDGLGPSGTTTRLFLGPRLNVVLLHQTAPPARERA